MTTREELHLLIAALPEAQTELARTWLEDLRHAADDRGLADIAAGRVKTLTEYEHERGL